VVEAHGVDTAARVRPDDGVPWQVILDVADKIEAGVIVAGISERTPAQPGTLGRQARALAHRSRRPLLLLPADAAPAAPDAPAIFAYDGSLPAEHALCAAAALLRPRPAVVASAWQSASYAVGLALLAVPDAVAHRGAGDLDAASRRQAEGRAQDGAAALAAAGWPCGVAALENRSVAAGIIGAAGEHDAAVIVTGTRGRSWMTAALLGSTAEGILRHAGRPVLLVPPAG
jgi:nucleotide-binding universal stress UspA family protein